MKSLRSPEILFEDNHVLAVNKPANCIVQGAGEQHDSLLEWARAYIKQKYAKPGNVYLGVVSRLDAPVTGVVPFARTSKSASRLSEQFRDRTAKKCYWAIVEGRPPFEQERLEHYLVRPESFNRTRVATATTSGSSLAILEYRLLRTYGSKSLLEIGLITGRKHQIRCQLAAIGCPILGDKLYGAASSFAEGIGLHCRKLEFEHPTLRTQMVIEAEVPETWPVL